MRELSGIRASVLEELEFVFPVTVLLDCGETSGEALRIPIFLAPHGDTSRGIFLFQSRLSWLEFRMRLRIVMILQHLVRVKRKCTILHRGCDQIVHNFSLSRSF